jgi:hypothetical protein
LASGTPEDDRLSPPWVQRGGVAVVVDDDEASSEEAANTSEAGSFTAAKRSPPPLPSSQKSKMCAAMGLEMPSCKENETPRQNLLFQTKLLYL